jgi:hypothetical protein
MRLRVGLALVALTLLPGCAREQPRVAESGGDYQATALAFVKALVARDYAAAYALTSASYRQANSQEAMQAAFERVVPTDWKTVGPVAVGETMTDWPDKQSGDVGWVYVSVAGDTYSEAVIAVVTREGGELKVRSADFGRP